MAQEPDFEGERVVIREMEEEKAQKKQGWFSRRTKKPSLPSSAGSRPPSAASFGSSRRKPSSRSQEDDLPPRTDATSSPLPSPAPGTPTSPERRSSDSTADVAVHAGFDLVAIKHMIGEAERHPEQLMAPQSKPNQDGSVLPPTLRSINSAPPMSPPIRQAGTGAVKAVPYDDVDKPPESGRNLGRDALSATFTRSMTLRDNDLYRTKDTTPKEQGREAKLCSESNPGLSRPSYPPDMSTVWSSPRGFDRQTSDDTTALGNPFAGSTKGRAFGGSSGYLAQPPHSHDRLGGLGAQEATTLANASPSLSFGSPDGTITFQGMEPDPWCSTAELRHPKAGNGLGMNPWST